MKIKKQPLFLDIANQIDLRVSLSGYVKTDTSWHKKPLFAPFSRIYYVLDGTGLLLTDTEQVKLEPGYVYLAPCGTRIGYDSDSSSVTKLFFHINVFLPNNLDIFTTFSHISKLERPIPYIEDLIKWYFSKDMTKYLLIKGELFRTVTDFIQEFHDGSVQNIKYSDCVSDAINYIRRHYSATLTVDNVASAIFSSRKHLSTTFKNEVGITVAHYIESLVMSDIQQMLSYTDTPVKAIAARYGFCDQYYLSRRFKQLFSISPSEYRTQKKIQGNYSE